MSLSNCVSSGCELLAASVGARCVLRPSASTSVPSPHRTSALTPRRRRRRWRRGGRRSAGSLAGRAHQRARVSQSNQPRRAEPAAAAFKSIARERAAPSAHRRRGRRRARPAAFQIQLPPVPARADRGAGGGGHLNPRGRTAATSGMRLTNRGGGQNRGPRRSGEGRG